MRGVSDNRRKVGIALQKETYDAYNEIVRCLNSKGVKITLSSLINKILQIVVTKSKPEGFVNFFFKKLYMSREFLYIKERCDRRYGKSRLRSRRYSLKYVGVVLDDDVIEWLDTAVEGIKLVLPTISRSIVVNAVLDSIRFVYNKSLCDILYNHLK